MSTPFITPAIFNCETVCAKFFTKQRNQSIESYFGRNTQAITINQIHSNCYIDVDSYAQSDLPTLKADALITHSADKILCIRTADCIPVLLADPNNHVIAAIHAGWRGALSGVIENTVAALINAGCNKHNIQAAIGPCIQAEHYEVGDDFYQQFIDKKTANQNFFTKTYKSDLWLFDLPAYGRQCLIDSGIQNIEDMQLDTYSQPQTFYSYRYNQCDNRQYSCIMLK